MHKLTPLTMQHHLRLAKHEVICQKAASKKRKVFDLRKQRLAGTGAEQFAAKAEKVAEVYEKKLSTKKVRVIDSCCVFNSHGLTSSLAEGLASTA